MGSVAMGALLLLLVYWAVTDMASYPTTLWLTASGSTYTNGRKQPLLLHSP